MVGETLYLHVPPVDAQHRKPGVPAVSVPVHFGHAVHTVGSGALPIARGVTRQTVVTSDATAVVPLENVLVLLYEPA